MKKTYIQPQFETIELTSYEDFLESPLREETPEDWGDGSGDEI